MMSGAIEIVDSNNLEEVSPLIRQYQEFYQIADIDDERNRQFFSQFGSTNPFGCQFAYRQEEAVVGFATVYLSYTSTIAAKVAVMNDLFTVESARGQGVGKSLIEYSRQYAKNNGAARLQWVTGEDNQQAQRLYDALDTTCRTWKFYTYSVVNED